MIQHLGGFVWIQQSKVSGRNMEVMLPTAHIHRERGGQAYCTCWESVTGTQHRGGWHRSLKGFIRADARKITHSDLLHLNTNTGRERACLWIKEHLLVCLARARNRRFKVAYSAKRNENAATKREEGDKILAGNQHATDSLPKRLKSDWMCVSLLGVIHLYVCECVCACMHGELRLLLCQEEAADIPVRIMVHMTFSKHVSSFFRVFHRGPALKILCLWNIQSYVIS